MHKAIEFPQYYFLNAYERVTASNHKALKKKVEFYLEDAERHPFPKIETPYWDVYDLHVPEDYEDFALEEIGEPPHPKDGSRPSIVCVQQLFHIRFWQGQVWPVAPVQYRIYIYERGKTCQALIEAVAPFEPDYTHNN